MALLAKDISIFVVHAEEFEANNTPNFVVQQIKEQLTFLERRFALKIQFSGTQLAGSEWEETELEQIKTAHFILLLVSPDFLKSDLIFDRILPVVLAQQDIGETNVIPVFIRACNYEGLSFSHLKMLPISAVPTTSSSWDSVDQPYAEIAKELTLRVQRLMAKSGEPDSAEKARIELSKSRKGAKRGRVLYKIPVSMQLNATSECLVRIAPEDLPEAVLKEMLPDPETAKVETLRRIGKIMRVQLFGDEEDKAFDVDIKSTADQPIEEDDFTEWKFDVTPLKEGKHKLHLLVSISFLQEQQEREYKDIIVLDREIEISNSAIEGTTDWERLAAENSLPISDDEEKHHQAMKEEDLADEVEEKELADDPKEEFAEELEHDNEPIAVEIPKPIREVDRPKVAMGGSGSKNKGGKYKGGKKSSKRPRKDATVKSTKLEKPKSKPSGNYRGNSKPKGSTTFGPTKGGDGFRRIALFLIPFLFLPVMLWLVAPQLLVPTIASMRYDEVGETVEGRTPVRKNGKWGYINNYGVESIPLEYDIVRDFDKGIAQVNKDGKWGAFIKEVPDGTEGISAIVKPKDAILLPVGVDEINAISADDASVVIDNKTINLDRAVFKKPKFRLPENLNENKPSINSNDPVKKEEQKKEFNNSRLGIDGKKIGEDMSSKPDQPDTKSREGAVINVIETNPINCNVKEYLAPKELPIDIIEKESLLPSSSRKILQINGIKAKVNEGGPKVD